MESEKTDSQANRIPTATYVMAAILAAVAGFVAIYLTFGSPGNAPPGSEARVAEPGPASPTDRTAEPSGARRGLSGLNSGEMAALVIHSKPQELPQVTFAAADGSDISLADWQGKVVLLNLWATWCAPCRKEMPHLDQLKAELGGDDFDVVAISIDRGGLDKPRQFLEQIGVKDLKLYNESTGTLAPALKAFGMPTTLLLDREGREIARLVGPAEWHSEDAKAVIRAAIGKGRGAS